MSCQADIPFSHEYLPTLPVAYQVVFGFAGAAVLAILGIYIEEMVFFFRRLYNWKPKDKAKWILGIYPILSVTAFVTLLIPRAAALRELVSSIYLSFCVYIFVTMMVGHYGGAKKMMTRLQGTQIKMSTLPFCCCCPCLPRPALTSRKLFVLETLVFQYAVLRPVLGYVQAALYADGKFGQNNTVGIALTITFGVITLTSTLTSMWCFNMLFMVARPYLTNMAIRPKHLCMTLVVFISSIQPVVINIFVVSGVMPCDGLLNPKSHGDRWHSIFLVFEMLVLSVVARRYYRRVTSHVYEDDRIDQDRRPDGSTLPRIDMSFNCVAVTPQSARWSTNDQRQTVLTLDGIGQQSSTDPTPPGESNGHHASKPTDDHNDYIPHYETVRISNHEIPADVK